MSGRVLIVDDAPDLRLLYRLSLERDGYEVAGEASTAAEARVIADREHPDVVLIDLVLPDGSGVELVAAMRDALPDAFIAVCSGLDDRELLRACRRVGANAQFDKGHVDDIATELRVAMRGR